MVRKQSKKLEKKQWLEKQVSENKWHKLEAEAYERLFETQNELRYKLDELINKKHWNDSRLRDEIQEMSDELFRIEHDVYAFADNILDCVEHDPDCYCNGQTQSGEVISLRKWDN